MQAVYFPFLTAPDLCVCARVCARAQKLHRPLRPRVFVWNDWSEGRKSASLSAGHRAERITNSIWPLATALHKQSVLDYFSAFDLFIFTQTHKDRIIEYTA